MVSNGASDDMTGACVMSDGVVYVRVCVMSAAMMSGVCVPSAAVTGMCVVVHYLVLHGTLEEILKLQNDIYSIVLAPQVTVKSQRISQELLRSIGMKYL